jgi:predicted transcriptional regulator
MSKPTHLNLGRRERQIIESIYRLGRPTVSEVLADLPDPPSYSAVRAMLGKLERKGFVKHQEDGPRYVYFPAVSPERARNTAMQHLVETFFQGSAESAAAALLGMAETSVDQTTLARLAAKVAQARKEGR